MSTRRKRSSLPPATAHADPESVAERGSLRAALVEQLHTAGQAQSTATVMYHAALAAKLDLSASEEKALDLLGRFGPLTAGDLAERTGLARASVTALVDRLERKRFARRIANPADGRSVLISAVGDQVARIGPQFADWVRALNELYATYSDDELALILRFMREATARQQLATAKLTEGP